MDGRNRSVVFLRMPPELLELVKRYQVASRMLALNAAVIRLLETHPDLVRMSEEWYAVYVSNWSATGKES